MPQASAEAAESLAETRRTNSMATKTKTAKSKKAKITVRDLKPKKDAKGGRLRMK